MLYINPILFMGTIPLQFTPLIAAQIQASFITNFKSLKDTLK